MTIASDPQHAQSRVARVLDESLKRIETPEAAQEVVARVERMSAGATEADLGDAAAEQTAPAESEAGAAASTIERKSPEVTGRPPEQAVADVLQTVAAHAVAPSPAAEPVVAAAQAKLKPSEPMGDPAARRGRRLLKQAVLRRMGPLNGLDARIYMAVNEAPHPPFLDSLAWATAVVTTGGWIWLLATLVAYLLRVPRSWQALKRLLPSVVIATWTVEYPIKAYFRRRRPFVEIVRALVIGKKPGSWSFPSGHTAASFASAWILSSVWRREAPVFFGLASTVGLSRIYVGAHYPGDVASGALLGTLLSELVRRLIARMLG
jgi:undecaprenyl-diphosphatase